jgi:hypothetical protein
MQQRAPPTEGDGVATLGQARALIGEHPRAQHVTWRVQRIGWCVLGLFIALGASGLLGAGGMFGQRRVTGAEGGIEVVHERVVRQSRPTTWSVVLPRGARTLTLRDPATERFEKRVIVPRPVAEHRVDGALVMEFHQADAAPMRVQLVMVPTRPGLLTVEIAAGTSMAALSILALP